MATLAQTPYIDDQQPEFGPPASELSTTCQECGAQGQTGPKCDQCGCAMPDAESASEDVGENEGAEEQLAVLGQALQAKFADTEKKRIYIEDRWLEDLRQYHGRYDPNVESGLVEAESCSLFLNITKPKTHAFSARVMDMVLPTDEKNWGLQPTPVPEVFGMAAMPDAQAMAPQADGTRAPVSTPEGAPVLEKDVVKGVKDEADARCEAMEDEIDDQLSEARYNAAQRKAIEQMARLGTGVLLGPVITDEWRVTWVPQPDPSTGKNQWVRTLVPNTDKRPGVQWVDCWNFYPDMSANDPTGWGFAFVQHLVNATEFRKMAKRFNFLADATKRVTAGEAGFNIMTLRWMNELKTLSETQNIIESRYRVLCYRGEIEVSDLKASGVDTAAMGLDDDEEYVQGVVWLCDGIVLKVALNPLDSGDLPFSVCYCDKDESSPFGTGVPRLMRGEQESVNAAWRMKHDNAGLSVCPQTVIKLSAVTPADGDYHMKPKKVWYVGDDVQRVQDVFHQFSIDSHQAELDNILQLGIRFADDVTQLPLIMQGDQAPHITQTAQGMSLLYNASTVVLRRTVKFYDDYVTEPMIGRFYDWNMQFNPRDDIKGDFRCVARGSSTLLDKEQQGQALDMAMQLAMQPTWQPYTDMKKLYRQALKAKRIQDVVLSDEEIDKNLKEQQAQAQAAAAAGQKQAPAGPTGPDPQLEQAKLAVKQDEINARREATASAERIAIARMSTDQKISLDEATAKFAAIKVREDSNNQRFNAELAMKAQRGTGI